MNRKMSPHETRKLWMGRVVIWVTIIIVLFPVLWIVMSSFSAGDSFFLSSLFPKKFSIEHYTSLFQETNFMLWTWNSVKLCLIVAAIQLAMTSLAAYAFSRLRFTGRKYGLMSLLVLQVFPSSMAVAGYYILIYEFGLVDSNAALIFVLAGGSAYNIWLLKSYIDGLPKELDEAAMVDGATHFQVFRKIILPLAAPQLAVIFLFSFIATYSEYVITSIFLQTPGIKKFMDPTNRVEMDRSETNFMVFRYAETLLNYAEAAFELGLKDQALQKVNEVRKRAGIKEKNSLTMDDIRNERRVELAFENLRYWDLVRWRVASKVMNNTTFSALIPWLDYKTKKYVFEKSVNTLNLPKTFLDKQYYLEIPGVAQNDLLEQNPGY